MKVLLFLLALAAVAFSTTVTIANSTMHPNADSLYNRLYWIFRSPPTVIVGTEGTDTFVVKLRHDLFVAGNFTDLEARVRSKNSNGVLVDPPLVTLTSDSAYTYVNIKYTSNQLTTNGNTYGCVPKGQIGDYLNYLCISQIEYWASEADRKLRQVNFNFTFLVNAKVSGEIITSAIEELLNGCDCQLVTDVDSTINLYGSDCATALPDNILTFGREYCIKTAAKTALGTNYFYNTTELIETYLAADGSSQSLDILSRATARTYGTSGSEKGVAIVKFKLASVSTPLKFRHTVVLQPNAVRGRLLQAAYEGKGVQLYSGEYVVKGIPGATTVVNGAASMTISALLLLILAVILI